MEDVKIKERKTQEYLDFVKGMETEYDGEKLTNATIGSEISQACELPPPKGVGF